MLSSSSASTSTSQSGPERLLSALSVLYAQQSTLGVPDIRILAPFLRNKVIELIDSDVLYFATGELPYYADEANGDLSIIINDKKIFIQCHDDNQQKRDIADRSHFKIITHDFLLSGDNVIEQLPTKWKPPLALVSMAYHHLDTDRFRLTEHQVASGWRACAAGTIAPCEKEGVDPWRFEDKDLSKHNRRRFNGNSVTNYGVDSNGKNVWIPINPQDSHRVYCWTGQGRPTRGMCFGCGLMGHQASKCKTSNWGAKGACYNCNGEFCKKGDKAPNCSGPCVKCLYSTKEDDWVLDGEGRMIVTSRKNCVMHGGRN